MDGTWNYIISIQVDDAFELSPSLFSLHYTFIFYLFPLFPRKKVLRTSKSFNSSFSLGKETNFIVHCAQFSLFFSYFSLQTHQTPVELSTKRKESNSSTQINKERREDEDKLNKNRELFIRNTFFCFFLIPIPHSRVLTERSKVSFLYSKSPI